MAHRNHSLIDDATAGIPFDVAASEIGVSVSSIRNWVKTGYLTQLKSNTISRTSYEVFIRDVAGAEKLTQRANKRLIDQHDHAALKAAVLTDLKQHRAADDCSLNYEQGLSNAYRNHEGIYYTPADIANSFFEVLPKDKKRLRFCDPCCGSGNFLVAAIQNGFAPESVFGFDVDPIALQIARARLAELTGSAPNTFNLSQQDFLEFSDRSKFDVIFTNPPWGKNYPSRSRTNLPIN